MAHQLYSSLVAKAAKLLSLLKNSIRTFNFSGILSLSKISQSETLLPSLLDVSIRPQLKPTAFPLFILFTRTNLCYSTTVTSCCYCFLSCWHLSVLFPLCHWSPWLVVPISVSPCLTCTSQPLPLHCSTVRKKIIWTPYFVSFDGTWPHPSFFWCCAVVLSPWQINTPNNICTSRCDSHRQWSSSKHSELSPEQLNYWQH